LKIFFRSKTGVEGDDSGGIAFSSIAEAADESLPHLPCSNKGN
jgi:hypothetical protein